jgi:hypothetical protein
MFARRSQLTEGSPGETAWKTPPNTGSGDATSMPWNHAYAG